MPPIDLRLLPRGKFAEGKPACVGVLALAAFAFGQGAFAIDFSWAPQLRLGTRATDNVRWNSVNQEAALGFDNGGGMLVKAETQDWKSTITPSFNFRRFAIGENLDADEYGAKSQHQWQTTDRLLTSMNLDYARDSTLTTELADAGVRSNIVANRDTVLAQPGFTFLIDDRNSVNASYLFQDVSFDTSANGQLVDFTYQQFTVGGTHVLSTQVRLFATAFASEFETPDINGKTRTYGGQAGAAYQFDDSLSVEGSAGYVTSDIDFQTSFLALDLGPPPRIVLVTQQDQASTSGPVASASIQKSFENTRTRLDYARRVSPSIRGSQQLEDDIQFTAEHDLNKVWRVGFRGGYNMRSAESEDVQTGLNQVRTNQLNRDQAVLAGWVAYRFSNELSVRSEYRFGRNSFDETLQRATIYNNALFFNLIYNGEPRFLRGY